MFFLSSKACDEYAQGSKEMQASHMPRRAGSLGKQKEPGCQHGNGESPATHEDGCLRRGEGESVPADAHHGKSALAGARQRLSAHRVAPLSAA